MRQGADKALWFHQILMNKDTHVTEPLIIQAAEYVGLNVEQLKQDMTDPLIIQQVQDNIALGKEAGVRVTPSFIVGGIFYPGFAQYDQLKERVAYASSNGQMH